VTTPPILGIDLGTTYSLVSVMTDAGPRLIPNALGEELTPSAVAVDSAGMVRVGAAALALSSLAPDRVALAFKRDMGTQAPRTIGGRRFTPTELSSLVLRQLREDAEAALGVAVSDAVITVPAYFDDRQRQETRNAGALAGLRVERLLNEPTAAALSYGLNRSTAFRGVVLDLGGGTFDVTALESTGDGIFEIRSSAGDTQLGGNDFREAIAREAARRYSERGGPDLTADARSWARLLAAAERAMHALSTEQTTRLVLPDPLGSGKHPALEVSLGRGDVESLWTPLLARFATPIRRALRDAGFREIEELVIVGGASRIPAVRRLFEEQLQRRASTGVEPDRAVALGAGIQAGLVGAHQAVQDVVVTDIAPFSLGVQTVSTATGEGVGDLFTPILERGTVLPASRSKILSTVQDRQAKIRLRVFQGEHSLCRDNLLLGEWMVEGIPPGPAGTQTVEIRLSYDLSGILEIDATIRETQHQLSFLLERRPGALTPAALAETRARLAKLKFHPREALPNATALSRAENVYVELIGQPREVLQAELVRFRAALERQDPGEIAVARQRLIQATRFLAEINPTPPGLPNP
jgi:molecular chaperone HscC